MEGVREDISTGDIQVVIRNKEQVRKRRLKSTCPGRGDNKCGGMKGARGRI